MQYFFLKYRLKGLYGNPRFGAASSLLIEPI